MEQDLPGHLDNNVSSSSCSASNRDWLPHAPDVPMVQEAPVCDPCSRTDDRLVPKRNSSHSGFVAQSWTQLDSSRCDSTHYDEQASSLLDQARVLAAHDDAVSSQASTGAMSLAVHYAPQLRWSSHDRDVPKLGILFHDIAGISAQARGDLSHASRAYATQMCIANYDCDGASNQRDENDQHDTDCQHTGNNVRMRRNDSEPDENGYGLAH